MISRQFSPQLCYATDNTANLHDILCMKQMNLQRAISKLLFFSLSKVNKIYYTSLFSTASVKGSLYGVEHTYFQAVACQKLVPGF